MTAEERRGWLERIQSDDSSRVISWLLHLDSVPTAKLPVVEGLDAEQEPFDTLMVTVLPSQRPNQTLVVVKPMLGGHPTSAIIGGSLNQKGELTSVSEGLVDVTCGTDGKRRKIIDAAGVGDPTGKRFESDPDYKRKSERFDSFLELVTLGQLEQLKR